MSTAIPLRESTTVATPVATTRLRSLDVIRGITVAFMILVNNSVDELAFGPLKHAHWNGWTPTDMVFPTFLFLMGTSLVFSFESRLRREVSRASLFLHVVRRSVILFLLGLLVNGFPLRRVRRMSLDDRRSVRNHRPLASRYTATFSGRGVRNRNGRTRGLL
jgi:predicted acyltransferase